MLVRRDALEQLGGLDEGFFLYCEDMDLCRRLRDAGYDVRYEPAAVAIHEGGASAPRASLLPGARREPHPLRAQAPRARSARCSSGSASRSAR